MEEDQLAIVGGGSLQLLAQVLGHLLVEVASLAREVHFSVRAGQFLLHFQALSFRLKHFLVKLQDVLVLFIQGVLTFQLQRLNLPVQL